MYIDLSTNVHEAPMFRGSTACLLLADARKHPWKFLDMVRRRSLESLISPPTGVTITRFKDISSELDMTLHRVVKKYYFRTHEMVLERIFDQFLNRGLTFFDIGANCGYWSVYALTRVSREGEVHAFEPVPQYFAFLRRLVELNPNYKVFANNVACGAERDRFRMAVVLPLSDNYNNYNVSIGSSSLQPGFLDHARELTETINVNVILFDDYVRDKVIDLDRIGLIKIDVEGFESAVLDGMKNILSKSGRKVPILCEITTDLRRVQPLDGRQIITRLEDHGYRCLNANDLRPVDRTTLGFQENVLCV
jgi:FkbM family methyltransferase